MERLRILFVTLSGTSGGIFKAFGKYLTDYDWLINVILGAVIASIVGFVMSFILGWIKRFIVSLIKK